MIIEERYALVEIDVPFLYTPHCLLCRKYCIWRTFPGAYLATDAKAVRSEFIFFVFYQWDIGQDKSKP